MEGIGSGVVRIVLVGIVGASAIVGGCGGVGAIEGAIVGSVGLSVGVRVGEILVAAVFYFWKKTINSV